MPQTNDWGDKPVQSASVNEWGDAPAGAAASAPHGGFWSDFKNNVLPQTILGKMGGSDIVQGVDTMREPGFDPKLEGAHKILAGTAKMAAPLALPYALAEPAAALTTLGGGILSQMVGSTAAQAFGASPGASDLIGDAAGIATGGLANKLTPSSSTLQRLWSVRNDPDLREAAFNLIPGGFGTKVRVAKNAYDAANKALEVPPPPSGKPIAAQPATENGAPQGVSKELWNRLSPEHQAKIRESMPNMPPPPGMQSPVDTSQVQLASDPFADIARFKGHDAPMTDLIRQFHAQWPKGTSLRDIAADVFGTPKGAVPSYQQALKIHEYMLKNNGKIPAAGELR